MVMAGRIISKGLSMKRIALLMGLMGVVLSSAGGCAETALPRSGHLVYLEPVEYATAFEAGLDAMRESFAIEKQDFQSGQIVGRSVVYPSDKLNDRFFTRLTGARQELRRKASLHLSKRTTGCAVEVRVDVERRDTQDYQIYEGILATENLRMRTPAERRDMAGADQREVWTFVRQDQAIEKLIIRGIRERLGLLDSTSSQ